MRLLNCFIGHTPLLYPSELYNYLFFAVEILIRNNLRIVTRLIGDEINRYTDKYIKILSYTN